MSEKVIKVALIGQPNVSKSTVFNHLTGLNQHVGNWLGKTVEQKTGKIVFKDYTIEICDLPGTYSLTSNFEEERIARDHIITEKPDLIITLLNATAIERSFYLLSEIFLLEVPVIAAINMVDVAKENTIATFGVPLKISEDQTLGEKIGELFTVPSAFAFLVFQMFFIPCIATVSTIIKESGLKLALSSFVLHLTVSFFIVTLQFLRFFFA